MVKLIKGTNDLQTRFPEIANQAHGWDPSTVMPGNNLKREWRCEKGHIYSQSPNKRTSRGDGCSVCSNRQLLVGYNDLKSTFPEVAATADGWDPETVVWGCNDKRDWKCEHGHTWKAAIKERTIGKGCPYCGGRDVWEGFNDLASQFPDISREAYGWDPKSIHYGSNKRMDFKCSAGHVYQARVAERTAHSETGCPVCANKQVLAGFNDLATHFPDLAKEADGWDPTNIVWGSHKKVDWKCELGHTWTVSIGSRTSALRSGMASGCPYCGNRKVWSGFNDLLSQYPETAKQADGWDPAKEVATNIKKRPWRCELGHTWKATVRSRVQLDTGCPVCANRTLLEGFNDLATHFPQLAKEADGWDPSKVIRGAAVKKTWICSEGHKWNALVSSRCGKGTGCPECAVYGFNKGKPSWFYLMQRPGEQQLGITNDIKQRMNHHRRDGWTEIEILGPYPGEVILDLETRFKKWLASDIGLVKGTRENWSTSDLEVNSLQELKEASGISTDLF